jgi:hypothetical protein
VGLVQDASVAVVWLAVDKEDTMNDMGENFRQELVQGCEQHDRWRGVKILLRVLLGLTGFVFALNGPAIGPLVAHISKDVVLVEPLEQSKPLVVFSMAEDLLTNRSSKGVSRAF